MYTPKLLNTGWIVLTCNLFLWINITVASPDEFHLKIPVTFLTVPIDFNQVVYVETTTTAKVTFDSSFDKESPDRQAYSSIVDVNPRDNKVSWKIKCDWLHRTAKVTTSYTIQNQPQEDTSASGSSSSRAIRWSLSIGEISASERKGYEITERPLSGGRA